MKSPDRELFGVTIRQSTKEKFLSVTDLQRAYEKARWQHGWNFKQVSHILSSAETKERLFFLLKERNIINIGNLMFMEMAEKEGIIKVLKGLGVYKTTGKGSDKSVMADPYIWVLIAMELNPMLYAKVIMWLTDSLIFDRVDAGSEYLPMNAAIKKVVSSPDYASFARAINVRVFGQHQTGMRNLACAQELRKIADIEKFIINAIEQGWLKSEGMIISAIETYK